MKKILLFTFLIFVSIGLMSQTVKRITDADFTVASTDNIIFTDDGGNTSGVSVNNADIIISPAIPGDAVCLDFRDNDYALGSRGTIEIYDGPDVSSNLIYTITN